MLADRCLLRTARLASLPSSSSFRPLALSTIRPLPRPPVLNNRSYATTYTEKFAEMTGLTGLMSNRYKLDDVPDLTGKVAVVTGGSAGIGEALVAGLVKKGCEVHIVSATKEHAQETIDKLAKEVPGASSLITHHQVDLGTMRDVIALSQKLAKSLSRLDMLYLIAGIGVAPYGETPDGLANHFAVNHLSHFAMTDVLLPKLKETSEKFPAGEKEGRYGVRIVVESSELHRASMSDVKFESVDEMNSGDRDETLLYGRSKLMGILFIRELAKHHLPPLTSATPVMAIAVHPGAVATGQQKGAVQAYPVIGTILENAAKVAFMAPEQGAESAFWAGTSPAVAERREEVQGRYFTEADGKVDTESAQAKDDALAKNLWNLSVRTLKDKAGYDVKMGRCEDGKV